MSKREPTILNVEILKDLWSQLTYIRSNDLDILPKGVKNIICDYITDIWDPKQNSSENHGSFLTKTIDKKIQKWWLNPRNLVCKLCHVPLLIDYFIVKIIPIENEDEFIATNICEICLGGITLDDIGLLEFKKYRWICIGDRWYAEFDEYKATIMPNTDLEIYKIQ